MPYHLSGDSILRHASTLRHSPRAMKLFASNKLYALATCLWLLFPTPNARADDVQLLGIDQQYDQVSWWTIGYHAGHSGCLIAASYPAYRDFPKSLSG